MLTPRLLLVHRAVITAGTLTAAATTLGYSVSAVSQQLSQLEHEAGSPLYERAGRGVRPTAAGLLLAEHATRILTAVGDEFAVTQGYVAASLGAAFVPALALGAVREHVLVRKLRTPPDPRHIWLATRPPLTTQPAVHHMITALKTAAGQQRQH